MNEQRQDFELLQRFTRQGEQAAFADVVRRHLDLVFATALRKVEDFGAAQEVAQNVFTVLACKAWRFAPDDSLPAWLHKTALLESKFWLRGEMRRRRREETAAELGTTMKTPEDQPAFQGLIPLLDDALLSLREKERTALLLRYYESQSLRSVGAALGVTEGTAQKRVQSALEKLADFFKRHGFKTATASVAAAALQHTATSASATVVSAVVGAVFQTAPPALVGMGAWLAWVASLSRVQTAALCVALAAVPVGWQLNESHAASVELKRIQTQLLAAQNEGATLQSKVEGLRVTSERLEQSMTQANEVAARAAESARAFDDWKKKTRALLTARDYQWSDDSEFVRIPKSILPELTELADFTPFSGPGVVKPSARELMGMTPLELQAVEETLLRQVPDLERERETRIVETNQPLGGRTLANRKFVLGKLGEEATPYADQILAELSHVLGEERLSAMHLQIGSTNIGWLKNMLPAEQNIDISLETSDKGTPKAMWTFSGATGGTPTAPVPYSANVVGYVNASLSKFLPDGNPMGTNASAKLGNLPVVEGLRQRAATWLQEQATARLGRKEKP